MDASTLVPAAVAAAAVTATAFFWWRSRVNAAAVDNALARIGGEPGKRGKRVAALEESLGRLERSTAQAQRERARLAGAVQAAPAGILMTDDHGVLLLANPVAEGWLGTRAGETVPQPAVREAVEKAILTRSPVTEELELYAPVRTVLEISAVPLDFGVESAGAVAFLDDVTEERRVAAVRRDFVANVSDRAHAPLTALAGLARNLADAATGKAAALAGRVRDEADRIGRLLDDILDLSQAEALAALEEPVTLASVVSSAVAAVKGRAEDSGVSIQTRAVPSNARVAGDERQLRSMLVRLVENAVVHGAGEEGEVRVRTEVGEEKITIEVSDDGPGIPETERERVFERFYRIGGPADPGSGLGLSIARHIAKNHGGDVEVSASEGGGAAFTVTLPRWRADA